MTKNQKLNVDEPRKAILKTDRLLELLVRSPLFLSGE